MGGGGPEAEGGQDLLDDLGLLDERDERGIHAGSS